MELKNEMDTILKKRKGQNINADFEIEKYWNKMTILLTQNEDETIDYLNECNEDELYYISEIFEDISEQFQSERFITCLRKLDKKFPNVDMTKDIDIAESYIEN